MIEQVDLFGNVIVEPQKLDRYLIERKLADELIGINSRDLVKLIYNPVRAILDFAKLCRGDPNGGTLISALFNPQRYDTATVASVSITTALADRGFASGLARALAWRGETVPTADTLARALETGFDGIQCVYDFPPAVARDLYVNFNAKRILDPCAGWGGRMIGAAAIGAHYHGYEPATQTYRGLLDLGAWLTTFDTGFTYELVNAPFEDASYLGHYDIAFTSPPYFDTEKYSDEPTQAGIRYATPDAFVRGFLYPLIDKATAASRHGLILNIASRRYPMHEWVQAAPGMSVTRTSSFGLMNSGGLGRDVSVGESFWHLVPSETAELSAMELLF